MASVHHHPLGFSSLVSPLFSLTFGKFSVETCMSIAVYICRCSKQTPDRSWGSELPVPGCCVKSGGSGSCGSSDEQMAPSTQRASCMRREAAWSHRRQKSSQVRVEALKSYQLHFDLGTHLPVSEYTHFMG